MSKSKSAVIVVGTKKRYRGKRGRNCGTGVYKLSKSRWGSYAVLVAHQQGLRRNRMARRYCNECKIQFHSRGVYLRHAKRKHLTKEIDCVMIQK